MGGVGAHWPLTQGPLGPLGPWGTLALGAHWSLGPGAHRLRITNMSVQSTYSSISLFKVITYMQAAYILKHSAFSLQLLPGADRCFSCQRKKLSMPDSCFTRQWNILLSHWHVFYLSDIEINSLTGILSIIDYLYWQIFFTCQSLKLLHWKVFYLSIKDVRPLTSILPVSDKFSKHIIQKRFPTREKDKQAETDFSWA